MTDSLKENVAALSCFAAPERRAGVLLLMGTLFLSLMCMGCAHTPKPYTLSPVVVPTNAPKVALYFDKGVTRKSAIGAHQLLRSAGVDVAQVDSQRINTKGLEGFDLFCVPGGNMYTYAGSISAEGKENIRQFIRAGGGYLGICGGAYFSATNVVWWGMSLPMEPLALFPGVSRGPILFWDTFRQRPCELRRATTNHPVSAAIPVSHKSLYWRGPMLIPTDKTSVEVLAEYAEISKPAMLAFEYGRGRVFLVGTHPELDVEDMCDGKKTTGHNKGWSLLRAALQWCLERTSHE